MWLNPEADGCVYDTVDCYHTCRGCKWAYVDLGGEWPLEYQDDEPVDPFGENEDNNGTV